jgi:hypothetical protein
LKFTHSTFGDRRQVGANARPRTAQEKEDKFFQPKMKTKALRTHRLGRSILL